MDQSIKTIQHDLQELWINQGAIFFNEGDSDFTRSSRLIHFGNWQEEYRSATANVALFDRSSTGKIELSGKEAGLFLQNSSTNQILSLKLNEGCELYFCNRTARVIAHCNAFYGGFPNHQSVYRLTVTPGYNQQLLQHLDRHIISEEVILEDKTDSLAQFHLCGPNAQTILNSCFGESIPLTQLFHQTNLSFKHREHNIDCLVALVDETGLPGYDIQCHFSDAIHLANWFIGQNIPLAGEYTYDILRIEAGHPIYGIDIDDKRFVMELPRVQRAISYQKGCFIGQEPIVMVRDRTGSVARTLLPLKIIDPVPGQENYIGLNNSFLDRSLKEDSEKRALSPKDKIYIEDKEVGLITSITYSPKFDRLLALGYLSHGHQEIGTRVKIGSSRIDAIVCALPE